MDSTASIHVVPAEPGWRVIIDDGGELVVLDAVLAWRVETYDDDRESLRSYVFPVCAVHGEYCTGYLRPDGKVELISDGVFDSLDEARAARRRAA